MANLIGPLVHAVADEIRRREAAGEDVGGFSVPKRFCDETGQIRTVESVKERELRWHGPPGRGCNLSWGTDPRRFLLPSGHPARRTRDGLGCVTYVDRMMFWGTVAAVDWAIEKWLTMPEWARKLLRSLDR